MPDGIDIFHVKEEIEASDMTAKEAVMSVDTERQKLEAEAEILNDRMVEEGENEDIMERLTQVYERLEEMDAATAEARASRILCGLGFTPEKQQKKTREFSGGWRMRIALARALFIQPTLLLLDEPTNHLDMEAVVWLEDYLSKWKKILFLVSHSQDFLNTVCTNIIHFTKKRFDYYGGNCKSGYHICDVCVCVCSVVFWCVLCAMLVNLARSLPHCTLRLVLGPVLALLAPCPPQHVKTIEMGIY